jgi:prephenate dehydrogenase
VSDQAPARPGRGTSQAPRPLQVAVIGVGLIGGSIGMVARRRLGAHVLGYDHEAAALARAQRLGAIDESCEQLACAVSDADYVFVSVPVGATVTAVRQALSACGPDCVVSDVGSTKRHVMREVADARFVGGHPLAGAEVAGVQAAREDLFDGAVWYLTPVSADGAPALSRLDGLIEQLGALPVVLDADSHDRLVASVSHLPHVLANVLVAQALRAEPPREGDPRAIAAVGSNPSFRDATRVAGANTAIWKDIYMSNSDLLAEAIDETIRELSGVRDALDAEDADALSAWQEQAREGRERLAPKDS